MLEQSESIGIRINTLKGDGEETRKKLVSEYGWELFPIPTISNGYTTHVSMRTLTDSDAYTQGYFYIQNPSSMIPAQELAPLPNSLVLDMCAAPGSKTTQLAAIMNNTGTVVAADASRDRLYRLQANLTRMGVANTQVVCADGRSLWKTYPEYFDFVLLDAPCSMDQQLPRKKIHELAKKQKWLLRSAVSCTKPGGTIVYSTCTSTTEENKEVIDWITKKEAEHIVVEEIRRIQKDATYESFYIAKMKKIASTVPPLL
jgi:16S rRNA (cytosine1407-C5)-methyltransferase